MMVYKVSQYDRERIYREAPHFHGPLSRPWKGPWINIQFGTQFCVRNFVFIF